MFTDATTKTMCVAAAARLLDVAAKAFLIESEKTRIAASSWAQFVWQAILNEARKPMLESGSRGSKKCALLYNLTFFAIFKILLDTVLL